MTSAELKAFLRYPEPGPVQRGGGMSLKAMAEQNIFPGDVYRLRNSTATVGRPKQCFVWEVGKNGMVTMSMFYRSEEQPERFELHVSQLRKDWTLADRNNSIRKYLGVAVPTTEEMH